MRSLGFLAKILSLVLIPNLGFALEGEIKSIMSKMSLEEKVEQMLVFGFAGTDFATSLGPRQKFLSPGSFIVFKRNIKNPYQLSKAISQAQKESVRKTGLPLLFMIDQEGGHVTRIKTKPTSPSALAMGRTGNTPLIAEIGYTTGLVLRSIGINMNLAPVLDIANPLGRHFIGNRSFGAEPKKVADYGVAFSTGLIKAGVIPTAKHFPGHGGTIQDSHKVQAKKDDSKRSLEQRDVFPFAEYSKLRGSKAIMIAHVAYPSLDASGTPATYSRPIITDLLRDQLGFGGLVITDDLEMSGASGVGDVGERAVRAILAGVDIVMVAWSLKKQKAVKRALLTAVRSQRISTDRIHDSVRRVLKAKLLIKEDELEGQAPTIRELKKNLSKLKELSHKVSYLNFESGFQEGEIARVLKRDSPILVFTGDRRFFHTFKGQIQQSSKMFSLRSHQPRDLVHIMSGNEYALSVYYATGQVTAQRLNQLPKEIRSRMIVVNTTYPGLVDRPQEFLKMINLNTRDYTSGAWLAESLNRFRLRSRLPTSATNHSNPRTLEK